MATRKIKGKTRVGQPIKVVDDQKVSKISLTKLEKQARREAAQSIRIAANGSFGGSYGGAGNSGSGAITSADSNFYSPQLSTDFLELPQSEREKRELFRFWYTCTEPGTEITMSDSSIKVIEDIKVGDCVFNGFGSPTNVIEIFRHDIKDALWCIKVRGGNKITRVTGNHPFLAVRSSNGLFRKPEFIYSKDLAVGDYICSPKCLGNASDDQINDHFLHEIESIEETPYEGPVFNFEVKGVGDEKSYIANGLATHNTHPIVGAAIDFHTDVPMSKIHLSLPKGSDVKKNKQILHFYEQMCKRIRLFQSLYDATHEYWLHGAAYLFAEDHDMTEEIPEELIADIKQEEVGEIDYAGRTIKKTQTVRDDKSTEEAFVNIKQYVQDHYQGWQRIQILPPEQIKLEVFQYTNRTTMQLIPSEKDRLVVLRAQQQDDPEASRIADDIPDQIKENLLSGQPIPLNTSPYDDFLCSSFCFHLAHKKSAYDDRGISVLERCHVPGTEITVKRGNQVLQLQIEQLDSKTDKILGDSGNWRKFTAGSRQYDGEIVGLVVNGVRGSVWMTPDHKMQILRGGNLVELTAGDILVNDSIQVIQEKISNINKDIERLKRGEIVYYRIGDVLRSQYNGLVYSLDVDVDHTFFANRLKHKNCLRTLIFQDKLRQAQTSIASRAMTPKRVVWADKMSEIDVGELRDQVDQALIDPDFTIVTNFEVHWDEIGARDRLLDLASEYEITNKLLYIGLRITESMLTGESSFSGERIHLDVMNTMYLLYRETIVAYVEENLFAPVAEKKGFYEIDEAGNKILLYPKLKFTRLALRDNSELQDFMFNLYQKGSLPISYIYELINVDPHDASAELRRDLFTPRDSTYNELVRTLLTDVGSKLAENSNVAQKIADDLGLELKEEGDDRFGSK